MLRDLEPCNPLDPLPVTVHEESAETEEEKTDMLSYLIWGGVILVCFYLGARLTFQTREKKKTMLRINFEDAKSMERKRGR